jgi:hypothetical protein
LSAYSFNTPEAGCSAAGFFAKIRYESTQSDEKMQPSGGKNQRAQDTAPGQKSKTSSSESNDAGKTNKDMKAEALPVEIVSIYPNWRGYEMFLVGDQIVVVNPRTLEIVAVLDV